MALVVVELEMLVHEQDALTTRPPACAVFGFPVVQRDNKFLQ